MVKAKELAADNPKHEVALNRLVQQNPSMTTDMLEKLWQARGTAEKAFNALATSMSLADQVGAVKELATAVGQAVKDLSLRGDDADDFRDTVMSLARETTGLSAPRLDLLQRALGSPFLLDVSDALDLAKDSQTLPQETQDAARELAGQLDQLQAAMGPGRLPGAPPTSLDQVAPGAVQTLRTNGIDINP